MATFSIFSSVNYAIIYKLWIIRYKASKHGQVGTPLCVSEVIAVCRAQEPGPPAAAGSCVTAAGADTHLGSKLFKAINVFTPNEWFCSPGSCKVQSGADEANKALPGPVLATLLQWALSTKQCPQPSSVMWPSLILFSKYIIVWNLMWTAPVAECCSVSGCLI